MVLTDNCESTQMYCEVI